MANKSKGLDWTSETTYRNEIVALGLRWCIEKIALRRPQPGGPDVVIFHVVAFAHAASEERSEAARAFDAAMNCHENEATADDVVRLLELVARTRSFDPRVLKEAMPLFAALSPVRTALAAAAKGGRS